jgi:hypothetical protein
MTESKYQYLENGFFARHETFCPRYGWLKKGFDGAVKDSSVFDRPDAIEELGVGKNMVRSIRFWCMAFKVIEPETDAHVRRISGSVRTTEFGRNLLSDGSGWDSYLEDPASLWLLHWQLFTRPIDATAWSIIINLNRTGAFTLKDLTDALMDNKDIYPNIAQSSFEKDASCFTRMYAPPSRQTSEEIECPFIQLDLLTPDEGKNTYRFNMEEKYSLPNLIFFAACFDYARRTSDLKTISLNKLVYGYNSPGAVFKISETDAGRRLEKAADLFHNVSFSESYGSRQLQFEESPEILCRKALTQYYLTRKSLRF